MKSILSKINKAAWKIRKSAAAKFNCPVMEIMWKPCFRQAKEEVMSETITYNLPSGKKVSISLFKEDIKATIESHGTLIMTPRNEYSQMISNSKQVLPIPEGKRDALRAMKAAQMRRIDASIKAGNEYDRHYRAVKNMMAE